MPIEPSLKSRHKLQRALGRISRYTGPNDSTMSARFVKAIQTHLNFRGAYSGGINGDFNADTAEGLQRYLRGIGKYSGSIDGTLTEQMWVDYLASVRSINQVTGQPAVALPTFANSVLPAITGTARVGFTLTASNGTWGSVTPDSYLYQWKKAGVAIAGAIANTYVPVVGDIGATITVTVTAVEEAYANASATSAATAAVIAA